MPIVFEHLRTRVSSVGVVGDGFVEALSRIDVAEGIIPRTRIGGRMVAINAGKRADLQKKELKEVTSVESRVADVRPAKIIVESSSNRIFTTISSSVLSWRCTCSVARGEMAMSIYNQQHWCDYIIDTLYIFKVNGGCSSRNFRIIEGARSTVLHFFACHVSYWESSSTATWYKLHLYL